MSAQSCAIARRASPPGSRKSPRERLGAQVELQNVGEVGSAEPPDRLAAAADQDGVADDATARALDGGRREGHGTQRIPVTSGKGEEDRRE